MLGKLVLAISVLTLCGCATKPANTGYVTSQDPIHLECIDRSIWAVNNSGRVDLEKECN